MNYTYLYIALVLNAFANILLKMGAIGHGGTSVAALIRNPFAVAGVAIFAANVYFYIQALRLLPVSLVYPVQTAAGFLIINTYGLVFLKESWSLMSLVGYAVIVVGMILVLNYR